MRLLTWGPAVRRRLSCFLVSLAVLGSGALPASAQKADVPLTKVIVARALERDVVDRVAALGTTRANESVEVTASVTEKIAELRFKDGQTVEKGQVLVVLERAEAKAALAAAEAILSERRAAYNRAKQLEKQQFTTTAQLDERLAAMREAEANVLMARARLAYREIVAPFGGMVGLRNVSVGKLVEPGTVIATIDDLSVIKVDFSVPALYLSILRSGLKIVGTSPSFEGRTFEGEVSSVDTRVDPVTRSIKARGIIPNPDGTLRPGLLITIDLMKNPRRAVVIPEEALVAQGDRNDVLVVDEKAQNKVEKRTVEVGTRMAGSVEIVNGLKAGELVIIHGTMRVRPGQRVEITEKQSDNQPLGELLKSGTGS